jgi:acyl carrier protein
MPTPEFELEIKELIIDALALEEISVEEIESTEPLFVEGLGLDSIDALELAMVLEERYGVAIGEDEDLNRQIFASVRELATYVDQQRAAS